MAWLNTWENRKAIKYEADVPALSLSGPNNSSETADVSADAAGLKLRVPVDLSPPPTDASDLNLE